MQSGNLFAVSAYSVQPRLSRGFVRVPARLWRWFARSQRVAAVCLCLLLTAGALLLVRSKTSRSSSSHRKVGGHLFIDTIEPEHTEDPVHRRTHTPPARKPRLRVAQPDLAETQGLTRPVETDPALQSRLPTPQGLYALTALDIDGNEVHFSQFAGKVLLIVNVASACGYTEQNYRGLQALYDKYGPYGLEIIAFPSNQFGGQEPGSDSHIKNFVQSRYNVTFRMMAKVDVKGENQHPVFKYLKRFLPVDQGGGGGVADGNDPVWNFNKFLVDKHGRPMAFYYQNFEGPRLESDVYMYLSAT